MTDENFEIEETTNDSPERIVIYGAPGVGKTTAMAGAPRLILLDLERGSRRIQHVRRNKNPILTFDDFKAAMTWLRNGKHDFQSFGIDTIDVLESMIHRYICAADGSSSIEDAKKGWGKGATAAAEQIRDVMVTIDDICFSRNMHFVGVAHQRLANVKNPSGFDYQRHDMSLHDKAVPFVRAAVDHVLLATRKVVVTDKDFDEKRARAVSTGERILRTAEGPAHIAKSRARLPDPIPLSWHDFVCHLAAAGWPRLLRETVVDNARRLGNAEAIRKVEGMLRENPEVGVLAGANRKLCDLLAPQAPSVVQNGAATTEGTKAGAQAPVAQK